MSHEMYIAEGENGSVLFDCLPSRSDVRNACDDLDGEVHVFYVRCAEVRREELFSMSEEDRGW